MKQFIRIFLLSTVLMLALTVSAIAGEVKPDSLTSGVGTISGDRIGGSSANWSIYKHSVFGGFKYYASHGGSSGSVILTTDSSDSGAFPLVASGQYAYGAKTTKSDYKNYHIQFAADLDAKCLQIVQEGSLEIYVGATTVSKNGTFNDETGIVGFKALNAKGEVVLEKETNTGVADGAQQVNTGWHKLPKTTTRIIISMRSTRHGLGTQPKNRSYVMYPYVYLRDASKPYIKEAGFVDDGNWKAATNNAGRSFTYKTIGDKIQYYVKFNEPIRIWDGYNSRNKKVLAKDGIYLGISARNGQNVYAKYTHYSGDTAYFEITIEDASNFLLSDSEGGLAATAAAYTLYINEGPTIRDYGGNVMDGRAISIGNKWKQGNRFVDDTAPGIAKEMTDEMGIYPTKYVDSQSFNLFGSLPAELVGKVSSGTSGNANLQPTMFSADGDTGMIFRIVIRDEIKKSMLNSDVKLKLLVSTKTTTISQNEPVYANLVAARYIGSNTNATNGVKNNVVTEMFFRYVPTADVTDEEIYYVSPAVSNDLPWYTTSSDLKYRVDAIKCPSDLIQTGDGKPLETVTNAKLDFATYPYAYGGKITSLSSGLRLMVDSKAPVYAEDFKNNYTLPTGWVTKLPTNARLYFDEGDNLSLDGGQISIYYYNDSNERVNVRISVSGSDPAYTITVPGAYDYSAYKHYLNIGSIRFEDTLPGDRPMYLEFTVSDRAGNTTDNKGKDNIKLLIDQNGPTVNGSSYTVEGTVGEVTYDVEDAGVGTLDKYIYYRVERIGDSVDTSTYDKAYDSDGEHTVTFSGNADSLDMWRVWANFGDSLGNRTKVSGGDELLFTPSESILMANRKFTLRFTSPNTVDNQPGVYLGTCKVPEDSYTINLYYKWVKGSTDDGKNAYLKTSFTNLSEMENFNFTKDIGRFFSGTLNGEYTLIAYAELLPDEVMQYNIRQSVYFDNTPPEISLNVRTFDTEAGFGSQHTVSYTVQDDGARYKGGYYTKNGNIKFGDTTPCLEIYIDDSLVSRFATQYPNNVRTIDLTQYAALYPEGRTLHYKVIAYDTCGNSTTVTSDTYNLDFIAPEISPVTVEGEGLRLLEDGDVPLYAFNNFQDIKKLSVTASDNQDKRITIAHSKGYAIAYHTAAESADSRDFTYENPLSSDFSITTRNGQRVYRFTFYAEDRWGNLSSSSVEFLRDEAAPVIKAFDLGSIAHTADEPRVMYFGYDVEDYEKEEFFTLTAVATNGTEVLSDAVTIEAGIDYFNNFTVSVTENCDLTIMVTDAFGKSSEYKVTVNNFDREAPVISLVEDSFEQVPETGAALYGSFKINITDNIGVLSRSVAIIPTGKTPAEEDFFLGEAFFDGYENVTEDILTGPISPYATANFDGTTVSYNALADGTYDVYVEALDRVHNRTVELVTSIEVTRQGARLTEDVTYTPSKDNPTAGQVVVKVNTDLPVARIYNAGEEGNIAAMLEYITDMRAGGYQYFWNGETKTIEDIEDVLALYEEIAEKYGSEPDTLTDEEKEIYKNIQGGGSFDPYAGILNPNAYATEAVGDILDFLHNEAFFAMDEDRNIDLDTPRLTPYLEYCEELSDYGFSYLYEMTDYLKIAGLYSDGDVTAADGTVAFADTGLSRMNILAYPTALDNYEISSFDPAVFTDYQLPEKTEYVNPFAATGSLSEEELFGIFSAGVDLTLFNYNETLGAYTSPFAEGEEYLLASDIEAVGLTDYLDSFEVHETYYTNPFVTDDETVYSASDLSRVVDAIAALKLLREKTVEAVAENFAKFYLTYTNQEYLTENTLRYRRNVDTIVRFVDRSGQIIKVPVKIDWIDPSLPGIPDTSIWLSGEEGYMYPDNQGNYDPVNYDSVTLSVEVPNEGIYLEYYLTDLPVDAVGVSAETQPVEGKTLYKSFTLTVTDNTIVEFTVVNPSATDKSKSEASQIFVIDCFDREAPTAELVIQPVENVTTETVNCDVMVYLEELYDNRGSVTYELYSKASGSDVWVYEDKWDSAIWNGTYASFAENTGDTEYKFVLWDKADNETEIPFSVDIIDKTPVAFDIKLLAGDKELTTALTAKDTADYRSTSYEYAVTDEAYSGTDLKVQVYIGDELVEEDTIYIGMTEWTYRYTSASGNVGTLSLEGFLFDTAAPEAIVKKILWQTPGELSSMDVLVSILDDHPETLTFVSASGALSDGTALTEADVDYEYDPDEKCGSAILNFAENGYIDLLFCDEAGNELLVQITVSELDRTAPKAYIQYSTEEPTNGNVQATIFLTEASDYRIIDMNNDILQDYASVYGTSVFYTFEENKTVFFQFRDRDGNTTEALVATVSCIDREAPVLSYTLLQNKALDIDGNLVDFRGAVTIQLSAAAPDVLIGSEDDTVLMLNANQDVYHTVMENGTYSFTYGDAAGNFSVLNVTVDLIDEIAPTAKITGNPTGWTNVAPQITIEAIHADDDNCDCGSYLVLNGRNHEEVIFTPTSNGRYSFVLRDECGNSTTEYVSVEYLDMIAPTISHEGASALYVYPGTFAANYKADFEKVTIADEGGSGITADGLTIHYGNFDENVPGEYTVTFTVSDNAGNTSVLTRTITVIGDDDVLVFINGIQLLPGSQTTFWNGEELEMTLLNAENCGDTVVYAFEKGYFNGAEMKGTMYKKLTAPDATTVLEADANGMYTLFVQTENRRTVIAYVFVAGAN